MLCKKRCPRKTKCKPISNIVSETSFVCIGYHNEQHEDCPQDIFRHCFKNEDTDSEYDYDEYDLKSVISVMSETLLINE
ncbi:hypothetical protein KAR91_46295, partial [Candidatus Pacearchaeota archaeon]|nr:hypothetical protein [Candidatus Pacearchaeota archaeon]